MTFFFAFYVPSSLFSTLAAANLRTQNNSLLYVLAPFVFFMLFWLHLLFWQLNFLMAVLLQREQRISLFMFSDRCIYPIIYLSEKMWNWIYVHITTYILNEIIALLGESFPTPQWTCFGLSYFVFFSLGCKSVSYCPKKNPMEPK